MLRRLCRPSPTVGGQILSGVWSTPGAIRRSGPGHRRRFGTLGRVEIRYGTLGRLPVAEVGAGEPLVVLAGLSPTTGFSGSLAVRFALGPLARFAPSRHLFVLNRRPDLPAGMTMGELAAEHADAIRARFDDRPVDVVGTSTGGSIAQQLAADRPEVVRRLLLISTACRLGPFGRSVQRAVAARVRTGESRRALATMASSLVPPWRGRSVVATATFLAPQRMITDRQGLADMATTIEAEDAFDLARCGPITAPALLLAGREDRFYSPALFEETARLLRNGRLTLLDGRGHVTVTQDRRFLPEVRSFLR